MEELMTFQPIGLPATRVVDSLAARRNRDMARSRIAAARVSANGGSAMDAALAAIGAEFDGTAEINSFKSRVAHYIALGTGHSAVQARYRGQVNLLRSYSLNAAILMVEHRYRRERAAFQIFSALGYSTRLPVEVLRELRLMLRLLRRSEFRAHFPAIVKFMLSGDADCFDDYLERVE
jgi:hypothetical protein